jgi:hypothetical protein
MKRASQCISSVDRGQGWRARALVRPLQDRDHRTSPAVRNRDPFRGRKRLADFISSPRRIRLRNERSRYVKASSYNPH